MNLFDYIKFQSMDITSRKEISTLPEPLIDILWNSDGLTSPLVRSTTFKAGYVAWKYNVGVADKKQFLTKLTEYYRANNTD